MNNDEVENRPNPEELLKALQKEDIQHSKGRLKIFLGMSAGVGKTYSMLEEAQKQKKNGIDIVVGTVMTHGRKETSKLLEGLKIIPEKWVTYKDSIFEELDLDEILRIKPQIVLVDELAHSNIPGSRHPKRWQDVLEILDAGIDVYTTLNVQHIESLKDVVESIAGIQIYETVPDVILEKATEIELVDITPEDLLQRLKEGKVYLGDQSQIAARHFFQEDRLMALREIVLRFTAEKINHDLHDKISTVERIEVWKPREKLLVAVSHNPQSQKLIRTTRRLAFNLNAPWVVVYVDSGMELSDEDSKMLEKNLALARELGAEVITTNDPDVSQAIQRIAKQKGATQIIIGRSSVRSFKDYFKPYSIADKLVRDAKEIDIHVIRETPLNVSFKNRKRKIHFPSHLSSYFFVILFTCLLTFLNVYLDQYTGYKVIGFIYLWAILILSLFLKIGPLLFAAVLFGLVWDYVFIFPFWTLYIETYEDIFLLGIYFLTALITGTLTNRIRQRQEMLAKREASTQAIYEIVSEISKAPSSKAIFNGIKSRIGSILKGTAEVIVKEIDNGLKWEEVPTIANDEKEKTVVDWVFQNDKEAGWSTSTLSSAKRLYIPLKGSQEVVGVLSFQPALPTNLTTEEHNFLYTAAQQLAYYLEKTFAEERAQKIEHLNLIERVYENILKLISEEFSTPIITINESIEELKETITGKEKIKQEKLLFRVQDAKEKLNYLLHNISAMAALCSGMVPLHKTQHSPKELIEHCCENMQEVLKEHHLKLLIEDNLPFIAIDFALTEILLYNLILNAVQCSHKGSEIGIEAKKSENFVIISVSDEGKGIPPEMLEKIFEKFYRVPGTETMGVGLGLPIAKIIAEIHNGKLKAENRETSGSKFILFLPSNF